MRKKEQVHTPGGHERERERETEERQRQRENKNKRKQQVTHLDVVKAGLHWSFKMSRQMPPFALMLGW